MSLSSESVWFEQVDTALIDYIQGIVKLPNDKGVLTPVPVKIRKPDEDFKIEEYPCITLYNLYSVRDEVRYYPDLVVVHQDPEANKVVRERGAIPYNLHYQIDFWSRLQSQMNDMTRLWVGHHPDKSFNLPVLDVSGNPRSSFVILTDDLKKVDMLSDTDRTFHSTLTYKIWVELDERIRVESDLITHVPEPLKGSIGGSVK